MYHIYILITRPFARKKKRRTTCPPIITELFLCFLLGSICFVLSRFLCRLKGFLGGFNGFLCVSDNVSLYAALENLG